MKGLILIFWIIFWLFVYKLSFLQRNYISTSHKFNIIRDNDGIPHIYAKNKRDLLFGLGYAQAQDRLFTLYIKKMFIQGRLSEVFGELLVLSDLEMRNIGFMEMGKNNKIHTDPQTLNLIQAFADGINQYAKNTKMLPFEFYLLWKDWDDWTVQNTLANINLLSFMLQFDWFYELARQRLLETIGFDIGIKAMSYGGKNLFRNLSIINDDELKELGKYKQYDFQQQIKILKEHWLSNNVSLGSIHFPKYQYKIQGTGSNAWVIGGQHTQHGKPILANDPHVGSMIPSLFYAVELVLLDEQNRIKNRKFGVIPDGVTSLPIGISQQIAWGTTAAYIDNKDVYYQTIRNNSGRIQYLFKDEWKDFKERKQLIKVRGGNDIQQIYYHTHRGVVLEQIFMDVHWKYGFPLHQKYKQNHTLTLVAGHFKIDNSSAKGHMATIIFQSIDQFRKGGDLIINPNTDSVFIMLNGSIGYRNVGGIPKRNIPQMGSFIKNGNTDLYDMGQYLTAQQGLNIIDPKRGYLSMGNNRFVSDNFEFRSSLHQIVTGRSYRLQAIIQQKIKNNQKFTFQDMKNMQLDQKDQFLSEVLLPLLGSLTHFREIWSNPQTQQLFSKLQKWDCVMGKDSIQASLYNIWQHIFQQSLFTLVGLNEQQVQAIVNHGFFQNYQFVLFQKIIKKQLTEEERPICQSLQTKKYLKFHPCEAAIALSFVKLPSQLKRIFQSNNVQDYKWGTIHQQYFKIVPFGQIPLLRNIWQRNYPVGGNSRTLFVAIQTYQSKTFNSIASPAFRFITDLNRTLFSLQVGQSDRLLSSPFYDNFVNKNKYVQYIVRNPFLQGLPDGWKQQIDTLH